MITARMYLLNNIRGHVQETQADLFHPKKCKKIIKN